MGEEAAQGDAVGKVACYCSFKSALSKEICLHPTYLSTSLLFRAARDVVPGPTGSSQESSSDSNPAAPVAAFDLC